MTAPVLLMVAVGALAVLGAGGVAIFRQRRRYRDAQRVAGFFDLLAPTAPDHAVGELPFAALPLLPGRLRRRALLLALGADVEPGLVRKLAERGGVLSAATRQCSSRRWRERVEGVRTLSALGGGDEVIPTLLSDPHPAVRAEAERWSAAHPHAGVDLRLVRSIRAGRADPRARRRDRRKDDRDSAGSAGA